MTFIGCLHVSSNNSPSQLSLVKACHVTVLRVVICLDINMVKFSTLHSSFLPNIIASFAAENDGKNIWMS